MNNATAESTNIYHSLDTIRNNMHNKEHKRFFGFNTWMACYFLPLGQLVLQMLEVFVI